MMMNVDICTANECGVNCMGCQIRALQRERNALVECLEQTLKVAKAMILTPDTGMLGKHTLKWAERLVARYPKSVPSMDDLLKFVGVAHDLAKDLSAGKVHEVRFEALKTQSEKLLLSSGREVSR